MYLYLCIKERTIDVTIDKWLYFLFLQYLNVNVGRRSYLCLEMGFCGRGFLTMFSWGRGSGTCDPPGRTCCCSEPCSLRGQTRSRWPRRTRCCGRDLPGPPPRQPTQPATSSTLQTGGGGGGGLIFSAELSRTHLNLKVEKFLINAQQLGASYFPCKKRKVL